MHFPVIDKTRRARFFLVRFKMEIFLKRMYNNGHIRKEQDNLSRRKKNKLSMKKIILITILLVMTIIVGVNKDAFYIEKEYTASNQMSSEEDGTKTEPKEISLLGNQEVRQEFIALESEITKVMIDFKAWEQRNGSGTIIVELQDQSGNILASSEKDVKKLKQSKTSVTTTFSLKAELQKNETYSIVIRSDNVENEKGVFLYGMEQKGKLFGDLTINQDNSDGRIKLKIGMMHFASNSMLMIFAVLLIALIIICLPLESMEIKISGKTVDFNKWISRILFIISVPMAFFIVQRYSGYGIGSFLRLSVKLKGLTNYLLYGLIWWILYLICNRTKYTAILLVGISSIAGLANYFVWEFRGIPIMAADIASLGTAMDVAEHYSYVLDISALWALTYTVAFICVTFSLKSYKGLGWRKRICVLIGFCIPYSVFYTQLLHGDLMKKHGITVSVWEPSRNYASNGSLLSFFLSYTYYVVEEPKNYSVENVETLVEKYKSDTLTEDTEDIRPNIIAIMNEAYADLSVDGKLETSEDYMPFVHGLSEDTVKGDLYVSVFAGNTANTEFEFLTGCSMAFLPFRSIPYDSYVKDTFPSITHNLIADGYTGNEAIHLATKSAWSRDVVYPLFGFENFIGASDVDQIEYIRNFASDKTVFDLLISKYEESRKISNDPFYTFTVTIQNHGGYSSSQGLVDTSIKITNDAQKQEEAEQYINLMKTTDDAFKDLVEYFSEVKEPTVIIMFGDHQPSLPTSFYESLMGKKISDFTLEDIKKKYTVPYIIWANYDIQEEEADMSANYLSAYLMKVIGGKLTGYQKYLLDLYEQVPMITANAYQGADGVLHELDEKSQYSDLIREYQMIQYNNLFDSENRIEQFYQFAQ